jgi:hypothetical protein
MAELISILNDESSGRQFSEDTRTGKSYKIFDDISKMTNSYHPAIRMKTAHSDSTEGGVLLFSLDGSSKEFCLLPAGICECETCAKEFAPLLKTQKSYQDDDVENVSIDSATERQKSSASCNSKDKKIGGAASNPILVESDVEDVEGNVLKIRVFQFKADSSMQDALSNLKSAAGISPTGDDEKGGKGSFFVRRSTRKKKPRFPVGCILSEKTIRAELHHNVAALRLLLYQNCEVPLSSKLSVAAMNSCDDALVPQGLEIAFDWGKKTLEELISELKTSNGVSDSTVSDPSEHLFFLYQKEKNSEDFEAGIMDSLFQIANLESPEFDSTSKNGKGKQKGASERGFQGTLLQSSSTAQNARDRNDSVCSQSSQRSEPTLKQKGENVVDPADMVEVSDEEKDIAIAVPMQKEKEALTDSSEDEGPAIIEKHDDASPCYTSPSKKRRPDDFMEVMEVEDDDKSDNPDDPDVIMLTRRLKQETNCRDEESCLKAVEWAIKNNPHEDESVIFDSALAKYLNEELNR